MNEKINQMAIDSPLNSIVELPCLLLTTSQAAKALSMSPRKLWELTNRGEIPCVRIGKMLRYSPDLLRQWIVGQQSKKSK
jgi:excisionase family DNA binding protein